MAKTKVSEWDAVPGNNTDIDSINIAEGCAPSGINNAIRELMSQVKDFQQGTYSDPFNGPVNGTIGATTPAAGAFTTLTASSTATLNTLASSGATLTGGSINNMAIGGSTAAAGAFTTLAASGAVTLSGGTANGVPYLNGSKVLTSGSALTFDGASLSVNSGTTNTVAIFTSTDAGAGIRLTDPTGSSSFETNGSLLRIGVDEDNVVASSEVAFRIDGSEKMRLTSTGLGIGTSSPGAKLQATDASAAQAVFTGWSATGANTSSGAIRLGGNASYQGKIDYAADGNTTFTYENTYASGVHNWKIAGSEGMRLTSTGLGIGTSSVDSKLRVLGATSGTGPASLRIGFNSTSVNYFDADTQYFRKGDGTSTVTINSSGNLGIGTSSPSQKLQVVGAVRVSDAATEANALQLSSTATTSTIETRYNFPLIFGTNATERLRIDSSGNLGLGVTPSAWSTSGITTKVLEMYNGGLNGSLAGFSDGSFQLSANAFYGTGGWTYKASDYASNYFQQNGRHVWRTAPSGTAGNAISFTQAMTLNASGQLGIGTTSPAYQLDVYKSTTDPQISIRDGAGDNSTSVLSLRFGHGYAGTAGSVIGSGKSGVWGGATSTWNSDLRFSTTSSGTITERARIDSNGNFGIGTTSPAQRLHISGAQIRLDNEGATAPTLYLRNTTGLSTIMWSSVGTALTFTTSDSVERARIDSSGNLLIGTTSAFNLGITCISFNEFSNVGLALRSTYAGTGGDYIYFSNSAGNGAGRITHNGTTTVAYTTSSDYRMKENVQPMTGALAKVAQLNPVTYNWKTDGSAGQGFIAHELQAVVPEAVVGEKDAVDADGKPKYQGIDTSFLVATLTAAIQEQQAIINQLKARLDAANL